jgi:hypothetical protein
MKHLCKYVSDKERPGISAGAGCIYLPLFEHFHPALLKVIALIILKAV